VGALCEALEASFPGRMISFLLHGSPALGGLAIGYSDVDFLDAPDELPSIPIIGRSSTFPVERGGNPITEDFARPMVRCGKPR